MSKSKYLKLTLKSKNILDFDVKLQILCHSYFKVFNHLQNLNHISNLDDNDIDLKPSVGINEFEIGSIFIKDANLELISTLNNMFKDYEINIDYKKIDFSNLHLLATSLILEVNGENYDFSLDSNKKLNKHKLEYIQKLLNKSKYSDLYEISQFYCKTHQSWHQYIEYVK